MKRTLIQKYSSSIIEGFVKKIDSIDEMKHNLTKGELKELFVHNILRFYLLDQFGIGSGIIINQAGLQSKQIDILIFDKKLLPPFIKEQNIGVYPIESVLAVIEVKTNLTRQSLIDTEEKFKQLREVIGSKDYSFYEDAHNLKPICGLIGFKGYGAREIKNQKGKVWLNNEFKHLMALCLVRRYSWIRTKGWSFREYEPETFEETKRFIAVILDNIRTKSNRPPYIIDDKHKDWLSIYIRDQEEIRDFFRKKLQ